MIWKIECGPRQVKSFNAALSAVNRTLKSFVEVNGLVGGEEHRSVLYSPFSAPDNPELQAALEQVGQRFGWCVNRENLSEVCGCLAGIVEHATLPVIDRRRTQADLSAAQVAKLQQEDAARKHAAEVQRIAAELRSKYPWAEPAGQSSPHARAAKNIKRELAQVFPGVKFSVRSDSFSMGNSVDVSWTLGPSAKDVDAVIKKYQYGHFNGMEDIYEHDRSAESVAVAQVLGQSKYVDSHREIPEAVRLLVAQALCDAQRIAFVGTRTRGLYGDGDIQTVSDHVYRILSVQSFPVDAEITGVESDRSVENHEPYRATFTVPQAAPVAVKAGGARMAVNAEKGGIELHFADKPIDSVLTILKASGWRWSRLGRCWYAKQDAQSQAIAERIAALAN